MTKDISVCIPTYNSSGFVLDALQSVIDQTVKVDEIIVCDNHSSDNTVEKVKQFQSNHNDFNIQVHVNTENIGFQKNFIKCYELASRSYFLILHSDDLLKPDSIQKLSDFLNEHPDLALVGGKADKIDAKGKKINEARKTETRIFQKGDFFEFVKETRSYIPYSTVLYRKKLIDKIGYLTEESIGPDDLYWPLVLQRFSIAILGESLIYMKEHTGQLHYKNFLKYKDLISFYIYKMDLILSIEKDKRHQKEMRRMFKTDLSNLCVYAGKSVEQYFGKIGISLIYFVKAIKYTPGIIFTKGYIKSLFITILMVFRLYPK